MTEQCVHHVPVHLSTMSPVCTGGKAPNTATTFLGGEPEIGNWGSHPEKLLRREYKTVDITLPFVDQVLCQEVLETRKEAGDVRS